MMLKALPAAIGAIGAMSSASAMAATVYGLVAGNGLVTFDTETGKIAAAQTVSGVEGRILGIDVRPADRKLYAVTDEGVIYWLDPATGAAASVSRLSTRFNGGSRVVMDFNPQADRLRLIGVTGVNFRINVDTGAVTTDGQLVYAANGHAAGRKPTVTAGAYTNSFAGTRGTELFNIDSARGLLLLQSPPNDGVNQARGALGIAVTRSAAFDIVVTAGDDNVAYLVDRGTLYTVDLDTGRATKLRTIRGLPPLIDIAVVPLR